MITISLDESLDKEVFKNFWDFSAENADFGERGIKRVHPTISEVNFELYIDTYYIEHADELTTAQHELQEVIDRTASDYFYAVSDVFGKNYSDTAYTGLLSIFDCNPRYVDEKRFQVFYKRDLLGKLEVAYHEVSHFIFFECAKNTCPDVVGSLDVNGGAYWALSEIFNVIILNQPNFQKVLQREEQMFYPTLAEYVGPVRKLYEEHHNNFCAFLTAGLEFLEAERKKRSWGRAIMGNGGNGGNGVIGDRYN